MSSLTTAGQNLNNATRPTRLACSSVDMLWVMSYAPGNGDEGTPISVNFTCKADLTLGIHIRLVVGRRAVTTRVHETDSPGCGRWQLNGCAPSFSKQRSSSSMVPLTIQAVDGENKVVDSVTFGDFVYNDVGIYPSFSPPISCPEDGSSRPSRPSLRIASGEGMDRLSKRRSPYSQSQSPSSSDSEYGSSQGCRSLTVPALRRASRQLGLDLEDINQTVILDIATPLDSFCFDWDESELAAGRRLVRFCRVQDGNRLIVSAERISQADYNPDDIVISCIYREETDSCCVTSVDIIHLLQRLVEADFEVDEKNRIRRNLEGLRPTTVSKTRPGFESFFQRIMDFPDPKPRKIEKDVKVFDWKLLPHALDKILSKYSLYGSPTTTSPKDEVQSPFLATMPPQDMSVAPLSGYGDGLSQLTHEPHLDTLYLSHVPPIVQLAQFPPSPDSSPEMHRRPSLQEEQLQSMYIDAELMQRYYPEPAIGFGVPTPGALPSSMYTVDSSRDASNFVADHDWTTSSPHDAALVSPQESSIFPLAYAYGQPDSAESAPIYAAPTFPINTYDSFEFQVLRDHNNLHAVPASQHA